MKRVPVAIVRFLMLILLLSACSPSEAQIATAIAQTETAKPTNTFTPGPTSTQTPEPTQTRTPTLEPTPTLALPDVVQQTYADIEVLLRQDFGDNLNLSAFSPGGWKKTMVKNYSPQMMLPLRSMGGITWHSIKLN